MSVKVRYGSDAAKEIAEGVLDWEMKVSSKLGTNGYSLQPFKPVCKACGSPEVGAQNSLCPTCREKVKSDENQTARKWKKILESGQNPVLKCNGKIRGLAEQLEKFVIGITEPANFDLIKTWLVKIESAKGSMCFQCDDCQFILNTAGSLATMIKRKENRNGRREIV